MIRSKHPSLMDRTSRVARRNRTPRPLRTVREALASYGSYNPASGFTPSCHRTKSCGSRRARRPSQCNGGLDSDPAVRVRGADPHLLCSKAAVRYLRLHRGLLSAPSWRTTFRVSIRFGPRSGVSTTSTPHPEASAPQRAAPAAGSPRSDNRSTSRSSRTSQPVSTVSTSWRMETSNPAARADSRPCLNGRGA
jgi:hypothetical protein